MVQISKFYARICLIKFLLLKYFYETNGYVILTNKFATFIDNFEVASNI